MLAQLLNQDFIQTKVDLKTPEEVIEYSSYPLLEKNKIKPSYVTAIKKSFYEYGPYFLIAPNFALLHAKPEDGVIETSLSLVTLKEPIYFKHKQNDPVKVVMTLASVDKNEHIEFTRQLMQILIQENSINTIFEQENKKDVIKYIKQALPKKKIRILTVCGMGLGSSLVLSMNVESVLKKLNVEYTIENTDLGSAQSIDTDIIMAAPQITQYLKEHKANIISISNILDEEEIKEKLSYLKKF